MPVKVVMPQLGESVVEGTITKWLKNPGDSVQEYDPLLEVNTDKVDSEIPSPANGVILATLVPAGTTVRAGTILAWIGQAGETIPGVEGQVTTSTTAVHAEPVAISTPTPETREIVPQPTAGRDGELGFISPVVARLAGDHHVDLYQVKGTGQSGRITKKDVLTYLEQREASATQPPISPPSAQPILVSPVPVPAAAGTIVPLSVVRRAIADHMVASKHTSPHVTTVMESDLSRIVAHRNTHKDAYGRDGVNLTFTAYFIAAIVSALKAYPIVNSSYVDQGILLHRQINIGMATSLGEEGLIVPVIKNADGLSLLGLARTINDLSARARAHKLLPEEVKGGTFTLTNHGISGSLFATPIINQPQCGILGVGAIQKRVVVLSDPNLGDTIAIRPMAYLTLTFDHRILDGVIADYFLGKVVESLQNFHE
jgi:2-oxoglutarate dehydrogenase E2 component (dihydrolipoamide succinyltransferase)